MSWFTDSVSKWGNSIKKRLPSTILGGLVGGPMGALAGASGMVDKVGAVISGDDSASRAAARYGGQADQYYNNAIDMQAQMLNQADERFAAEQAELDALREKADTLYDPMERELAAQVMGDANTEGAADRARGEFTTSFDQATDQARRQMLRAGVRPNDTMDARLDRQSAYDRARGAASVANQARTIEDDKHFLRKSTFFSQNGSGIRERLRSGMQDRYSAMQIANADARNFSQAQGDRYQGYSNTMNQQSGNGLNALLGLGGTIVGGLIGGPVGAGIGGSIGQAMSGGQPPAQGAHGTVATNPSRPAGFDPYTLYEPRRTGGGVRMDMNEWR